MINISDTAIPISRRQRPAPENWWNRIAAANTPAQQVREAGSSQSELDLLANLRDKGLLIEEEYQANPAPAIDLELDGIWLIQGESVMRLLRGWEEFAYVIFQMAERSLHLVNLVTDLSLRPVVGLPVYYLKTPLITFSIGLAGTPRLNW